MATELRFPVEIDAGQAAKELDKLQRDMDRLKKNMESGEAKRAPIVEQLKQAQDEAAQAYDKVEKLKSSLAESETRSKMAPFAKELLSAERQAAAIANAMETSRKRSVELENSDNFDENAFKKEVANYRDLTNKFGEAVDRVKSLRAGLLQKESALGLTSEKDVGTYLLEARRQEEIKAQLAEQEKILAEKEKTAQSLEAQDAKIVAQLEKQTAELGEQEARAGELTQIITDASKGADIKAALAAAQESIKGGIKNLLKYGIGIRSLFVLFRKLKEYTVDAVNAYAENDPETQKSINDLKASLQGLKGSWGAAFAPILTAVIPVLQTLIGWITKAVDAIAAFFAALSGRSTFKRAITNTGKLSDNLSSGAGAAKEMKKQLMGIDTLTIAQDSSSGGGGGGGSGSGLEYEDVQISDKLKNNLELIKDIVIAIGAGIAGWGLGKVLSNLGLIKGGFKQLLGIALLVSGAVVAIKGGIDAWKNGVDWQNLLEMIGGVAIAAGGAALAFGAIGAAITLLIGGIGVLVIGIREWIETGELSHETGLLIAAGLLAIGVAISLLTKSWIPLLIAAILAIALTIYNYWGEISGWFKEHVAEPLKKMIADVKEWFGDKIDAIREKFDALKTKAADAKESVVEKFESLKEKLHTIIENIKSFFRFDWQLPQLKLPHLQVQWQDAGALAQFFGIRQIPHLSVSWYAKGGIVDGATLIGAGEAGKEAIVPLERNTQWVTMVANELADIMFDRMTDKFAGLNMRMPAVAMGGVVPPNAFSSGYGYGISPELESKLDALLDRLTSRGNEQIKPSDVYLDKRKVGEIMYTYTEERNRGRGK